MARGRRVASSQVKNLLPIRGSCRKVAGERIERCPCFDPGEGVPAVKTQIYGTAVRTTSDAPAITHSSLGVGRDRVAGAATLAVSAAEANTRWRQGTRGKAQGMRGIQQAMCGLRLVPAGLFPMRRLDLVARTRGVRSWSPPM